MSEQTPVFRTLEFQVQAGDTSAEIISAISQLMASYSPLKAEHEDAIVAWLVGRYGHGAQLVRS